DISDAEQFSHGHSRRAQVDAAGTLYVHNVAIWDLTTNDALRDIVVERAVAGYLLNEGTIGEGDRDAERQGGDQLESPEARLRQLTMDRREQPPDGINPLYLGASIPFSAAIQLGSCF